MNPQPAPVPQPTELVDTTGTCEVLLIRHGRSADVVPGTPEAHDPPLHPEGIAQAEQLDRRLASRHIDAVYSSNLTRAKQTAAPLAARRGLAVTEIADLDEVRLGSWAQGEFRRRVAERDPEWLAWTRRRTWDGIPGAEGDLAFRTRVSGVIDTLAQRHQGGTIAVVAHGGVIGTFLAHALGMPHSLWMTCENTSVSLIRIGDLGTHVVTVNDAHHLFDPVTKARG
jgi:broad specificity phosphatase PhoE